jgi:hypothetical protein
VASTWYQVTPMKDSSHPLRNGQPYVICASLTPSSSVHPAIQTQVEPGTGDADDYPAADTLRVQDFLGFL